MAHLDGGPRVGRSQGALIFWGLVSVFFAAATCYYFSKNYENEKKADSLRDEVLALQDERDSLNSQKEKLQAGIGETETQLKTREEFLQDKETQLAAEESRLQALGQQSQNQTQQVQGQATVIKKFNDAIRKLGQDRGGDVVERGGRPVLRVPNEALFAPGDAALKPDGKALLTQIAQALNGQLDNFELRVVSYTDSEAEIQKISADASATAKPDAGKKKETPDKTAPADDAASKPRYATSWDLTNARASTLARFFRDQTSLPFQNVLVSGRGDSEPIVPNAKEGHARNRRVEITVVPLPASFHAPDPGRAAANASADPLAPPPDAPAPSKKARGN